MKKYVSFLATLCIILSLILCVCPFSMAAKTRGDANDDDNLDMKDVLVMRKSMANLSVTINLKAADCNADGSLDMKDVLMLRKYLAHMDVVFPPLDDNPGEIDPAPKETGFLVESHNPERITIAYYDDGNTSSASMGITWHSTLPTDPMLQYVEYPASGEPDFSKATTITPETAKYNGGYCAAVDPDTCEYTLTGGKALTDYTYRAVLSGLSFNTKYAFRVCDKTTRIFSDIGTFTTKPAENTDFSFVFLSDTQHQQMADPIQHTYFLNTLKGASQLDPDFDFIMHGGDVVQQGGYLHHWRMMIDGTREYLMNYPIMLVTGNHESTNGNSGEYCTLRHTTVNLAEPNSKTHFGIYYSFDYSNAHFIVLNSNTSTTRDGIDLEQKNWLAEDLEAHKDAKWTIVLQHNPMIGSKNDDTGYTAQLFEQYGVDLCLQADEHVYTISYPWNTTDKPLTNEPKETIDGIDYYVNPAGTVYQTTATGGVSQQTLKSTAVTSRLTAWGDGKQSSWANIYVTGDKLTVKTYYYNDGNPTPYPKGTWGIYKP